MEGSEVAAGVQEISEEKRFQQLPREEDQADKTSNGSGSMYKEINAETWGMNWEDWNDLKTGE